MTPSNGSTRPSRPYAPREVSLQLVQRIPWIREQCTGRTVLHLGCMNAPNTGAAIQAGAHLHLALRAVCARLTGVDHDLTDRDLLPPDSDRHDIRKADVCDQAQLAAAIDGRPYEMIVAGELLEHLPNPGLCLTAIGSLLPDATLLVTVPNALGGDVAERARRGVECVHTDHVCWYSPRTLGKLLEKSGWNQTHLSAAGHRYAAARRAAKYGPGNLRAPILIAQSRRT